MGFSKLSWRHLLAWICFAGGFFQETLSGPADGGSSKPPRYAALRFSKAHWRRGPGPDHPVDWIYLCAGWPVIIQRSLGHWYFVIDCDGIEGWVKRSLLDFKRTAVVREEMVPLREKPDHTSRIVLYAQKGVIGRWIEEKGEWACLSFLLPPEIKSSKKWFLGRKPSVKGWLPRRAIWP